MKTAQDDQGSDLQDLSRCRERDFEEVFWRSLGQQLCFRRADASELNRKFVLWHCAR